MAVSVNDAWGTTEGKEVGAKHISNRRYFSAPANYSYVWIHGK